MNSESKKRIARDQSAMDTISSLPINIKHSILDFLPNRDAARTSILSKAWTYVWATNPQLVLDEDILKLIKSDRSKPSQYQSAYVNLVNQILLQHIGPILEFGLELPEVDPTLYSKVDSWMFFLSRKGPLKKLTLDNPNPTPYRIPSRVLSSSSLVLLSVSGCILRTPATFAYSTVLSGLILENVTLEESVLSISNLLLLCIRNCRGLHNLRISDSAPQLSDLSLGDNDHLQLSNFLNCTNVSTAYLVQSQGLEHHRQDERITLTKLVSCWPKLKELSLNGYFLKYMAAGNTIPERLPKDMTCLKDLVLYNFSYDLEEIACILCLLRSSINLQMLAISASESIKQDTQILDYLQQPGLMKQSMNGLQIVRMLDFQGSAPEMHLAQLLLANGPSIEGMYVRQNRKDDEVKCLETTIGLMTYSRASPKAKMYFLPGAAVDYILESC